MNPSFTDAISQEATINALGLAGFICHCIVNCPLIA